MRRQLGQLSYLQEELGCPVVIAGDIFDKPNSSPTLINFAIEHMPDWVLAIPGQHDLPNHSYENISRSAYWTLVKAKKIKHLGQTFVIEGDEIGLGYPKLRFHPFPWGFELGGLNEDSKEGEMDIAVVHDYIWVNDKKFIGAPEEKRVSKRTKTFKGYDALIFGDNHKGFICNQVINCGTFMRRKIDEINYKPMVVLLMKDGSYKRMYFDCSNDKFLEVESLEKLTEAAMDIGELIKELSDARIGRKFIDFRDAVKEFCEKNEIGKTIQSLLSEMME